MHRRPGYVISQPNTHVGGKFREDRICERCRQPYIAHCANQRFCDEKCVTAGRARGKLAPVPKYREPRFALLDELIASGQGDVITAEGKSILAHLRARGHA
jgi:hypothetical protein